MLMTCSRAVKCPTYDKLIKTNSALLNEDLKECRIRLVYVGADWCPPCQKVHPWLNNQAIKYSGVVKFIYMDATNSTEDVKKANIGYNGYIPFFRLYIDKEIAFEGNSDAEELNGILKGAVISLPFRDK